MTGRDGGHEWRAGLLFTVVFAVALALLLTRRSLVARAGQCAAPYELDVMFRRRYDPTGRPDRSQRLRPQPIVVRTGKAQIVGRGLLRGRL